ECYLQGVRDYLKYMKRGYSRASHLASIDIRNGRMTRDEALELARGYEGKRPPSLDLFLEYVGLSEREFVEIAGAHAVSPYEHDPALAVPGRAVHDFELWPRHAAMRRDDALVQLGRRRRVGRAA